MGRRASRQAKSPSTRTMGRFSTSTPTSDTRSRATAAPGCCCCSRRGRAKGTTAATGPSSRASALLSCAARCLRVGAPLPAVVREAVDRELERNEEKRVDQCKQERARGVVAAVLRADEVDEHEDHRAEDRCALRGTLPRRRRGNADLATAALLRRLRLRLGLGGIALLRRSGELLGRLVELVPLGIDPDGLVLVPAFLLRPAPLLPRGHGGLA